MLLSRFDLFPASPALCFTRRMAFTIRQFQFFVAVAEQGIGVARRAEPVDLAIPGDGGDHDLKAIFIVRASSARPVDYPRGSSVPASCDQDPADRL